MPASRFSWRLALRIWLLVFVVGVAIAFACAIWERLPMSEGGSAVAPFFVGVLGALVELVGTIPLRWIVSVDSTEVLHLRWLIIPNFALLGVMPGVVAGFVGDGDLRRIDTDKRPYFRMNDRDD